VNQQPAEQDSTSYWAYPSTPPGDCRLVDDTIEEYALGIAEDVQRHAIERHIIRCKRCADLITSYKQTAAALALSVPTNAPPAGTKEVILNRIAVTPQDVYRPTTFFAGNLDSLTTPTLPASTQVGVSPKSGLRPDQGPWWRVYAAPLATLPLLLALGLVGAWGFNNYMKVDDLRNEVAQLAQEPVQASTTGNTQNIEEAVRLAFRPTSVLYDLTSVGAAQDADSWGQLLADPETGQGVLQVTGLAAGSYAVLVQTRDGSMVQKAVFEVADDGTASTVVNFGDQVSDFRSVHVRPKDPAIDIAVDADFNDDEFTDVLLTVFEPNINQDSGTSLQGT
jgi:hypothetical protein